MIASCYNIRLEVAPSLAMPIIFSSISYITILSILSFYCYFNYAANVIFFYFSCVKAYQSCQNQTAT